MVRKETRKDSLLRLISDIGGEGTREQINAKVPKYWELSNEELEIEAGKRDERKKGRGVLFLPNLSSLSTRFLGLP